LTKSEKRIGHEPANVGEYLDQDAIYLGECLDLDYAAKFRTYCRPHGPHDGKGNILILVFSFNATLSEICHPILVYEFASGSLSRRQFPAKHGY
jgi:hypothetical protein